MGTSYKILSKNFIENKAWLKKQINFTFDVAFDVAIPYNASKSIFHESLIITKKNFMAHFYGWGSTASRLEPLQGGSLLFTTKFPDIPGTHFIDLEGWKAESTLEPPSGFEPGTPGLEIQHLNY